MSAASHLRVSRLPNLVTSSLPTRLVIKACRPNGEVDTDWNGKMEVIPCSSLVDDSFNDGRMGKWRIGSREEGVGEDDSLDCSIVPCPSNPRCDSTFCMKIVGGVGDAKVDRNWEKGCKRVFDHLRPTRMSLNVRSASNDRESLALFVTGPSDRVAMVFTMRSNGRMGIEEELINDGLGQHNQLTVPYKPDTWYEVEFAFDWDRTTFDFLVDGVEVSAGVPFENQRVKSIGKVFVSNSHPDSETFVDRLRLIDEGSKPAASIQGPHKMNEGTWVGYFEVPGSNSNMVFIASSSASKAGGSHGAVVDGRSCVFSADPVDRDAVERGNVTGMGKDFLDMLGDDSLSDLTLIVEGRRVPVHRAVLFARCPSFRSMLTSGMRECADKDLVIEDAEYGPFYTLLQFVYSGCSSLIEPHIAIAVLKLADRYILQGLVRACEAVLVPTISKATVASLLEVADLYSANILKQVCVNFVVSNFAAVVHSPEYAQLDTQMMLIVQKALAPHVACTLQGACSEQGAASAPKPSGRGRVR